jgi:hypothetical protein
MTHRLGPDQLQALRRVPLPAVLQTCGARPDRYDRKKWHTAQGCLSVTGMQFMNWNHGRGGGGAIDLVMHLENLDFPAAVDWLRQRFSMPLLPAPSDPPPARGLLLPPPPRRQTFWRPIERRACIMVAFGESAKAIFDGAACFRRKTCFPTSMGITFHFKGLGLCLKMNTGAHKTCFQSGKR